jgi:hypothetical protein
MGSGGCLEDVLALTPGRGAALTERQLELGEQTARRYSRGDRELA